MGPTRGHDDDDDDDDDEEEEEEEEDEEQYSRGGGAVCALTQSRQNVDTSAMTQTTGVSRVLVVSATSLSDERRPTIHDMTATRR